MLSFSDSHLWRSTLGSALSGDVYQQPRERLRTEYLATRQRAALLTAEIPQDLREFTVHDVTHLDALWEMASIAAGEGYPLNPLEAFVLGVAFLIHDAGMSLAAYPDGRPALRKEKIWLDALVLAFQRRFQRAPTKDECDNPPLEVEHEAISDVLRMLHAKQAERLATISWRESKNGDPLFLLSDPDLRADLGTTIGRIAHSHWWNVSDLRRQFPVTLGAPTGFPIDWSVDPMKVACLLRVADASHIDARRAPRYLRALRRPSGISDQHWLFQSKLHQPRLENDRLVYTAGSTFALDDAHSWWLCYDTLQMIDRELREVDSLLADTRKTRFRARGVAGVEDPGRLAELIPTEHWEPVDTRLRVSDVAALAERIGGQELYGNDLSVPIRELVQNAADAVRARRVLDSHPDTWGTIIVRVGSDSHGPWVEVTDTGVGMSKHVLSGPLLDFGTSYWNSSLMRDEWPGLVGRGFKPVGRYGIGFFSVFMLGKRVRVVTRRIEEARRDTRVLEFLTGAASRPVLRNAAEDEVLTEGGTAVRVWLNAPLEALLLTRKGETTLEDLLAWLCPALDVDLQVQRERAEPLTIVRANDWITMDGEALLARVRDIPDTWWLRRYDSPIEPNVAASLRLLKDKHGNATGRAAFHSYRNNRSHGVLCVGGLRSCYLQNISGVLLGYPTTAARNSGLPLVDEGERIRWAEEQASLVLKVFRDDDARQACGALIYLLGGDPGRVPVAETAKGPLTLRQVVNWASGRNRIVLVVRDAQWVMMSERGQIELEDDVISVDMFSGGPLVNGTARTNWPWDDDRPFAGTPGAAAVVESICKAWHTSASALFSDGATPEDARPTSAVIGRRARKPVTLRDVHIFHRKGHGE